MIEYDLKMNNFWSYIKIFSRNKDRNWTIQETLSQYVKSRAE